jgi:putative chitinase
MNLENLRGVIPDHILDSITSDFLLKAGIDGPKRLSHFLGQTEEESGKFTRESENLNYRLSALYSEDPAHPALWQKHFTSLADAQGYANNPEMIANRIYANRMGNGDEASGDGWKYRGRGDIELTGKDEYQNFQDWINIGSNEEVDFINNPDLVMTSPYDLLSAAWFFNSKHLWDICDKGIDMATVSIITRHVNGGQLGVDVRYQYTQQIYNALVGV